MKKKILALCLILILITQCMSFAQINWSTVNASSSDFSIGWDDVLYEYNGYASIVVIPDGVTGIGDNAFSNCDWVKNVTIPDSVTWIGESAFFGCTSLKKVTMPDYLEGIGDYAFSGCENLNSISMPDSVYWIGQSAFSDCRSLTNVTVPRSLTYLNDNTFCDCYNLASVDMPVSLESIGDSVFWGTALKEITIPKSVNYIGDCVFFDCQNLNNIYVNSKNKNFCSVDGVLYNADKTELVRVPPARTGTFKVPGTVKVIGVDAFGSCNVTGISLPESIVSIDGGAFDCCAVKNLVLPRSVEEIDGSILYDSHPDSIVLPDTFTIIQSDWFFNCGVRSITIPKSIECIVEGAFSSTEDLTDVYYTGSKKQWNEIDIEDDNDCLLDAAIHYNSTVRQPLQITLQPVKAKAVKGGTVSFKVKATGDGLSYQWQLSDDRGKTWRNSSCKAATYTTTMNDSNNGRFMRCIVKDQYGNKLISDVVSMKIMTPLKIVTQPVKAKAKKGGTVSFTVKATGDGLSYQWQLSDDRGKIWRNSSCKAATNTTTMSDSNNGRFMRCIVKDQYGNEVITNVVSMKIAVLKLTVQPKNAKAEKGKTVSFSVKAEGEGIKYQWQLSDDKGKTWRNSSCKSAAYSTVITDANNGRYVRCVVTDSYGNSVRSDAAVMKIK